MFINYNLSVCAILKMYSTEANQTGDLFKLVVVNSYGSQEEQKLEDDGKLLKLLSKPTYIVYLVALPMSSENKVL